MACGLRLRGDGTPVKSCLVCVESCPSWIPDSDLMSMKPRGLTIAEVLIEAYDCMVAKGFHEEPVAIDTYTSNIHGEVSEIWEDHRHGKKPTDRWYEDDGKPCGMGSEAADIILRTLDMCKDLGIDIEFELKEKMAYNRTRPYRNGGKTA